VRVVCIAREFPQLLDLVKKHIEVGIHAHHPIAH
jgi:hypothetical protein